MKLQLVNKTLRGVACVLFVVIVVTSVVADSVPNYKCLGAPRVSMGCPTQGDCGGGCTTILYQRTVYSCWQYQNSYCDPTGIVYPPGGGPWYAIYEGTCAPEGGYCLCPLPSQGQQPVDVGTIGYECTSYFAGG